MKITVCIGSSCHIKGSRRVVDELQRLLAAHELTDKVVNRNCELCSHQS